MSIDDGFGFHQYQQEKAFFFVFDPADGDHRFFKTAEARDAYAEHCISLYLDEGWDEGWDEEVENLFCGKVTHTAQQVDRVDRPDNLDEDGTDEEGRWWDPDWAYVCNYKAVPVPPTEAELKQQLIAGFAAVNLAPVGVPLIVIDSVLQKYRARRLEYAASYDGSQMFYREEDLVFDDEGGAYRSKAEPLPNIIGWRHP